MAVTEDSSSGGVAVMTMIDEIYEFSAPRFFDFTKGESDEDISKAELWFERTVSYAPSPFMPRIKTGRSIKLDSLCDFSDADQMQKVSDSSGVTSANNSSEIKSESSGVTSANNSSEIKSESDDMPRIETREEDKTVDELDKERKETACSEEAKRSSVKTEIADTKDDSKIDSCCTPPVSAPKEEGLLTNTKKHKSAKQIASLVKNPSTLRPKTRSQSSLVKGSKSQSVRRDANAKNTDGTKHLAQENQAVKRQKLEEGRSRQILNVKPPQLLHHKSKLAVSGNTSSSLANKIQKEERKVYVREPATTPFVSMAEMMKKFQSSTRSLSLPNTRNSSHSHDAAATVNQMKAPLSLTRPKEPELETSQRVRPVRVKSTAELEEETMAKIPKFKARPLNKKILEGPSLPALPRSTPQLPEFQEFHFETTARANQNAESASVASTEASHKKYQWKPNYLTEPKTPTLHTSLRARPTTVKSSIELEKEELEKIPKFRARPLNRKIFESKGELGIFCNTKKHVTIPQEFHFATSERIPPPAVIADLFDKLSLNSEPRHENPVPRKTVPNPFHLHTEERGTEKERKFVMDLLQKQMEEERARVPRANPYPYTTDYPVIPPKPEPKPCTRPEPFLLESLMRHEEEMQREMEERRRVEKEEAEMRLFKAQPVLKEDPIPLPEKVRKPLTQVEQFTLHVDNRAVDRAEFDQKVKEKEQLYKRYREESEAARMIEEERALKQLRRTMVPHARPVPNFDHPFCPKKSSKGTTKAKSPNLRVLQRKERHRMMVKAAVSSPASCMR